MAGDKVNNYSQVDSNILELQLTTDKTFKGYHQLTLTNYDNTTVPAIAAGSAIEVNGALYKFDSEEAISTTDPVTSAAVADGTVYVCIIPDTTTATAAFTATAPTWSDSKQGWYGTGGQANYRYAEYVMTKATSAYSYKNLLWCKYKNRLSAFGYATLSGNQSISTASSHLIRLDTVLSSQNITFSSNSFTVTSPGEYKIIIHNAVSGSFSTGWVTVARATNNDYSGLYSSAGLGLYYSGSRYLSSYGEASYPGEHIIYLKSGAIIESRELTAGTGSSFNVLSGSFLIVKKIDDYIL
jgi:hypothetical protein